MRATDRGMPSRGTMRPPSHGRARAKVAAATASNRSTIPEAPPPAAPPAPSPSERSGAAGAGSSGSSAARRSRTPRLSCRAGVASPATGSSRTIGETTWEWGTATGRVRIGCAPGEGVGEAAGRGDETGKIAEAAAAGRSPGRLCAPEAAQQSQGSPAGAAPCWSARSQPRQQRPRQELPVRTQRER